MKKITLTDVSFIIKQNEEAYLLLLGKLNDMIKSPTLFKETDLSVIKEVMNSPIYNSYCISTKSSHTVKIHCNLVSLSLTFELLCENNDSYVCLKSADINDIFLKKLAKEIDYFFKTGTPLKGSTKLDIRAY